MADSVIFIAYPTPATLSCPLCHVVFKQALKHLHIAKHVAEHHPGHGTKLRCATCCAEFSNARSAGRHKCAGASAPTNEVAMVRLTEDSAIYEYPPGPSQCPLCTWVSQAKDTAAVTSIEKHLMRIHQHNKPKRLWRCRICNTIADGIKMRTHVCDTQGEPTLSPTPAQPTTPSPINEEADESPARCSQPPEGEEVTVWGRGLLHIFSVTTITCI